MRKKKYTNVGELIEAYRVLRGLSITQLATKAGIAQSSLSNILRSGPNREQTKRPKRLTELIMVLDIPKEEYRQFIGDIDLPSLADSAAESDFAVYYSKPLRGGLALNMELYEKHPRPSVLANVADSYGIIVSGTTMIPAFKPGNIIWVNPHLPPSVDSDILLRNAEDHNHVILRCFESETETEWHVLQYNPPLRSVLLKSEWPTCEVIVGMYRRS